MRLKEVKKVTKEIDLFFVLLREAPLKIVPPLFGHCPLGGGGLNPCPDGLGHFFREEFTKFKQAFAWLRGGLNPCQDGLGHLCSENWSSIWYFLLLTMDLRLARILCGTHIPSKWWFDKVAEIGPEKSAPECPFEGGGGGCNRYLGNAQIGVVLFSKVLPLGLRTIHTSTNTITDGEDNQKCFFLYCLITHSQTNVTLHTQCVLHTDTITEREDDQ